MTQTSRLPALAPLSALDGYALDGETSAILARAGALAALSGGRRLTTSFILMALVERAADAAHPLHFLVPLLLEPDPCAYRGVMAAYAAWYAGDSRLAEGAASEMLSPYVSGVLDLAAQVARATSKRGLITPLHILAALLRYRPEGGDGIEPGAQYILGQCPPWPDVLLAGLRRALGPHAPPAWMRLLERPT
jgi:hypothetical protein